MAEDYLVSRAAAGIKKIEDTLMRIPTPGSKSQPQPAQDTSWHDSMVSAANASFSKPEKSAAKAKAQGHSYSAAQA